MMLKPLVQTRGKSGSTLEDVASIALFLAAFGAAWQVVYLAGVFPEQSLPSPIAVARSFADLSAEGSLGIGVAVTMSRLAVGFAIAVALGGAVGLAMVRFKDFGKTMSSFSVGLQSFPSIAWVPFTILLIGFNDFGILFVMVISSVFSVMMSTYSGIRNIPPIYMRAARNMGASGSMLFRHVMIPAATPTLIIGLRQAWSFAWHALVGAEILISLVGLGHILSVGREFLRMDWIMATMIVIFVIGMVVDRVIFYKLEERIRSRWGLNQHAE
ncbi:ABC transporter permease [Nitrososphaera sp.]|uniref:ABC transporter permease n=1 Tax=Nitrososphaera sp. TaxID=1971748 RepID=UPI002EDA59DA